MAGALHQGEMYCLCYEASDGHAACPSHGVCTVIRPADHLHASASLLSSAYDERDGLTPLRAALNMALCIAPP